MKTVRVSIFGGGISGLSCAHHLINLSKTYHVKFVIDVYEKKSVVGGLARSSRDPQSGCSSEVCWRVYFGFYNNLLSMFGEIPTPKGRVLDNLTPYVHKNVTDKPLSIADYGRAGLDILYGMTSSDDRLQQMDAEGLTWYDSLKGIPFSELKSVGGWLGMDRFKSSYNSVIKVGMEMQMYNSLWPGYLDYVTTAPTSEAVFKWWQLYLERNGVTFHVNDSLEDIRINNGKVSDAQATSGSVTSDYYVLNLPVDELDRLIQRVPYLKHSSLSDNVKWLAQESTHLQVSFQVYFDKKVSFGGNSGGITNGILVTNSPWELIVLSYDNTFTPDVKLCGNITPPPLGGLSIASCTTYINGVYGKPLVKCTYEEMKRDIWAQMTGSDALQELVYDNNGFYLDDLKIVWWSPLWETLYYNNEGVLQSSEPKITNNVGSLARRPSYVIDGVSNSFIATAYIKETIDIYSMEAAAIAGKTVGDAIMSSVDDHTPTYRENDTFVIDRPLLFAPFRAMDKISHSLGGPNVGVWALMLMLLGLIVFCVWRSTQ